MSTDETVNEQITDAVTQDNTEVVGEAPAEAMGSLDAAEEKETEPLGSEDDAVTKPPTTVDPQVTDAATNENEEAKSNSGCFCC